jgi:hypothetical protein
MELLQERLSDHPAVDMVEVDRRSGSVLLLGGRSEALRSALEEFVELVEEKGPEGVRDAGVAMAVTAVKELDGRLAGVSGGRLSLRWMVPATFVAFGLRQLLAQGLTVGAVPWYVLLYYGVDSLLKLYPEHAPRAHLAGPGTGPP